VLGAGNGCWIGCGLAILAVGAAWDSVCAAGKVNVNDLRDMGLHGRVKYGTGYCMKMRRPDRESLESGWHWEEVVSSMSGSGSRRRGVVITVIPHAFNFKGFLRNSTRKMNIYK
jgi:hypothetical protein